MSICKRCHDRILDCSVMTDTRLGVSMRGLLAGLIPLVLFLGLGIVDVAEASSRIVDSGSEEGRLMVTKDSPAIMDMTGPADSTFADGEVLTFTIDYGQVVTVSGTPSIELDVDGATRSANFVSGSGSQTLIFEYTVQSGEDDIDGIEFAGTTIQGGTIEDGDGDAAERDFGSVSPDLSAVRTDGTPPASLSIVDPTGENLRASTSTNNGETTLDVTYSYSDNTPDTTTITFTDGANSATFGVDDSGYAGDGSQRSLTLDLTNPDEESGGLMGGSTYDLQLVTTDQAAQSGSTTQGGVLTIDNAAPSVNSFAATNPSGQDVKVILETDEGLAGTDSLQVDLSGPETATLTRPDFTESKSGGTWIYTATYAGTSDGSYTATLVSARDSVGNDAASGQTVGVMVDTKKPTIVEGTLASDNEFVEVAFSEGVYANNDGTGGVTKDDVSLMFGSNGGTVTGVSISDVTDTTGASPGGGEDTLRVHLSISDGPAFGKETVEIQSKSSAIYDAAGNAMDDAETTGSLTLNDRSPPANLSVDAPSSLTFRASTASFGGRTTLDVVYSYNDVSPDTTVITLTDGTNSASFGIDDTGYPADGTQRTETLDLTSPDASSGGLQDGVTYDVQISSTDTAGQSNTSTSAGLLSIDNSPPPILSISLSNDGSDNLDFSFDTDERLATANSALTVEVEGPNTGPGWMTFNRGDFSVADNGDGTFTYMLATTQSYSDGSGTYTATVTTARDTARNDGADGSDEDSYTFNLPPVAVPDADTTTENTSVSRGAPGLLGNDSDPNGDSFSISQVQNGAGSNLGSQFALDSGALLTVQSDGQYSFDPNDSFESLAPNDTTTETFTYTIEDAFGETDQAVVKLAIAGINDAPDFQDDMYSTTEDDTLFQAAPGIFDNDDDPEGDDLQVIAVNGGTNIGSEFDLPSGASLKVDAEGSFYYVPTQSQIDTLADGESITDSFTYSAVDGNGGSGQASVTVTITGVNDPPVLETNSALAVSSSGDTKTIPTGNLSASDPDTKPSNLTFNVTSTPSNGTLIVDGISGAGSFTQQQVIDGVVKYEHDGSSSTNDQFTFELVDADGAGPASAPFDIVIGLDNTPPTATNDDSTTTEDDVLAVPDSINGVLGDDSDPDGDPLKVLEVNGVSGNVGTEIELTSGALLTINEDGTYTYKPNGTFEYLGNGDSNSESVSYAATDGKGGEDTATLTITIEGVNDAPTLDTNGGLIVESGETEAITVLDLSASDPDDARSAITYTLTEAPTDGTLLLGGTPLSVGDSFTQQDVVDGAVAYQNPAGATTGDQFKFDLSDGTDPGPQGQAFTIIPANRPPSASDDNYSTPEDQALIVSDSTNGVLGNDSDPDGDPLSASISSTPDHGSLTLNDNGTFEYVPEENYNGSDGFGYQVSDGEGEIDEGSVDLTVSAVNDAPRVTVNEGLTVSQTGQRALSTSNLSATDVEDGARALTFTVTSVPTRGAILVNGRDSSQFTQQTLANGKVSYDHTASTVENDQFVFSLSDSEGAGPSGRQFTITVQEANLAPTAHDTSLVANEDSVASGNAPGVLGNDRDPDDDELSVSAVNGGVGGNVGSQITLDSGALLTLNGNGSYAYDPNDQFEDLQEGESGSDSFTYTATDGNGGTDQATVSVTIQGQNELPTVTLDAPLSGSVVQVGRQVTLDASASDEDGSIREVTFRVDDATIGTDEDGSDGFQASWTPGTTGTVTVVAEATDDKGATVRSAPAEIRVRAVQVGLSINRQFPNPTDTTGFRLVALPGQVDRSLQSTLDALADDDWRAFRETGGSGSSASEPEKCTEEKCTFRPGRGFWLIARESWTVEDSLGTVSLQPGSTQTTSVYSIPLHDGWNVISNPLAVDVPWSTVKKASGLPANNKPWRFTGQWERASTFASARSGEAYYFRDDDIDSLVVPYPSPAPASETDDPSTPASLRASTESGASSPSLTLNIVGAEETVSTIRAGIYPDSKVGFDPTDQYGPPGYFSGATLRLIEPKDNGSQVLYSEYKPPRREGYTYDVRLRSVPDTVLTVEARGTDRFSQEQISLVRLSTAREYDLRSDSTLSVVPETKTTRFQLLIGSEAYVEEARKKLAPDEAKLLPNYPEPFRATTRIEYALPERQEVRLAVYDVLGRRVAVLVDGSQSAGFHHLQWPRSGGSRPLASGMYFLRLRTGSTTKTERLVVVR